LHQFIFSGVTIKISTSGDVEHRRHADSGLYVRAHGRLPNADASEGPNEIISSSPVSAVLASAIHPKAGMLDRSLDCLRDANIEVGAEKSNSLDCSSFHSAASSNFFTD
jgi:hypothetical protein